jgi:hypothetical protein
MAATDLGRLDPNTPAGLASSGPSIALSRAASVIRKQNPDENAPQDGSQEAQNPKTPPDQITVRTRNADPSAERHYVIVVHGTFDPPSPDDKVPKWYHPDPGNPKNFCTILADNLAKSSMALGGSAVWRELPVWAPPKLRSVCCGIFPAEAEVVVPYPFHWDGTNTHAGRIEGGRQLAVLMNTIGKNDPAARIHLVAHSHGGNVVLAGIHVRMGANLPGFLVSVLCADRRKFMDLRVQRQLLPEIPSLLRLALLGCHVSMSACGLC